ncbi:MAG: HNH endonuclease family protein [Actinomycetes bacterium]
MRKLATSILIAVFAVGGVELSGAASTAASQPKASFILSKLLTKGRAPKTGYDRALFSDGWGDIGDCDARNYILKRDLTSIVWRNSPRCTVGSGTLQDPYTGKTIYFVRGVSTSSAVQIDHMVAVSDAWQKGAQKLSSAKRYAFYNDPLNLMAVDGPANQQKSDSDAASWLPPNRAFWCPYVARQIAVKYKYSLWVTSAERVSMVSVLKTCPNQVIPQG